MELRWLSGMLNEVEGVMELRDPGQEISAHCQVIGELPPDLKKLYSYCDALVERINDLQKEADETDSKQAARELRRLIGVMKVRKRLAAGILWEEIRFAFKDRLDPDRPMSLGKGFVLCMDPPRPEMPSLLRGLFGGDFPA
jgi:hypothetical protein